MKIIVLKNNLKEGLDAVSRTVGEKINLPILKNVLIDGEDGKIKIFATNLETAIIKEVSGKIIEPGKITVPFDVLFNIISNVPGERINLETKKSNLFLKTDNYEASIQGVNSDEFPIIPKIKKDKNFLEIQGAILKEGMNKIINACQISELRPELSGILFNVEGEAIKLTATDSFRLAEKTIPSSQFKNHFADKVKKIIIPLKAVQEATRSLEENSSIKIFIDDAQILFQSETIEIISRLIDGQFPDYEQIVPKEVDAEILLNRDELISALKLVSVFSSRNNEVSIKIQENKKTLEIYSVDSALGENKYLIPIKIKGESSGVAFNWRYFVDGLKNVGLENVFLGLQGDARPAIIKSTNDPSYFYVLMPIKNS